MKTLALYDDRKPVYFGIGVPEKHLPGWFQGCNAMKINRQQRELARLRALEHISIRFELCRKFKDWHNYVLCRRLLNKHKLRQSFASWRQAFMIKRYAILEALINNNKMFIRKRFQKWHDRTLFLRALSFYNNCLKRKYFGEWLNLLHRGRTDKVGKYFKLWKDWLSLLKTLKKLVCVVNCLSKMIITSV
jgi:hypothetical protein